MKKVITALLAMFLVCKAEASISLNVDAILGYIVPVGATDDSSLFSGSSLVQIIWTANNAYSSAASAVGGGVDSGFTVLYSGVVTVTGGLIPSGDVDGSATYDSALVAPANINNGYVYARLFNDSMPVVGSYYTHSSLIGPTLADASTIPPPVATEIDLGQGPAAIDLGGYYVNPFNIEVVPEPSVLAFLGLGGLALAVRRRFVA